MAHPLDSDQIVDIIIGEIRETVPELADRPIGRADSMADLGVDSIERSEIILATLEAVGLKIPMVQLHGPRNIGELADLIDAKKSG
ncbi:acyl carrier protein [Rhodobium gokarnense]|uniref:Polyketide biosynthesis acyl carrier protein n=1 Tax=Rhodobium gokarnense TaxID=364296 RepID=A0ABT3H846_9HYPH|nr:acyl carrier protein [Rhodobium gokarnense]MCW2306568.1 polyketide biosynthesis acyl carrier protein [Rhodobium gokarnense]